MILDLRSDLPENPASRLTGMCMACTLKCGVNLDAWCLARQATNRVVPGSKRLFG
jgi:hypothetical protein